MAVLHRIRLQNGSQISSRKHVAGNKLRGGNATGAGVTFQASAAQLLAERPLDGRLGLGGAKARSIRFESEAPLDDILLVRRRSCRCANRYCVSRWGIPNDYV